MRRKPGARDCVYILCFRCCYTHFHILLWIWGHPSCQLHACLHRVLRQAACWCDGRTACLQRAIIRQCASILYLPQAAAFLRGRRSECCHSDIRLESLSTITISILQRLEVGSACAMQFLADYLQTRWKASVFWAMSQKGTRTIISSVLISGVVIRLYYSLLITYIYHSQRDKRCTRWNFSIKV